MKSLFDDKFDQIYKEARTLWREAFSNPQNEEIISVDKAVEVAYKLLAKRAELFKLPIYYRFPYRFSETCYTIYVLIVEIAHCIVVTTNRDRSLNTNSRLEILDKVLDIYISCPKDHITNAAGESDIKNEFEEYALKRKNYQYQLYGIDFDNFDEVIKSKDRTLLMKEYLAVKREISLYDKEVSFDLRLKSGSRIYMTATKATLENYARLQRSGIELDESAVMSLAAQRATDRKKTLYKRELELIGKLS